MSLSTQSSCKQCLNAGISYLHHLVGAEDNITLSTCRYATFAALASQSDSVSAIDIASCFFGVQGLKIELNIICRDLISGREPVIVSPMLPEALGKLESQNLSSCLLPYHSLTMAIANFLLILLILPSLEALSDASFPHKNNLTMQDMMKQACIGTIAPQSCISNLQSECERKGSQSPTSILRAALTATMNEARRAIELFTKFYVLSNNPREQVAVEDCKELLDFSVSELAWSLAEMEKMRANSENIHYEGNLKAWLSAALSNQDTCLEGFEGTNGDIKSYIKGSLKQVTQLISNVLSMYSRLHRLPIEPPIDSPKRREYPGFPTWITDGDRDLLLAGSHGMHVDAVVALDGSGQFQSIMQAVYEAPNYSERRYIIHVKKGIYRENIDLKKKKTNIMLVGDGMGVTVVSGNRNFMQGWTTFRTATVAVSGKGFIARDMTIRNTAGPENHQAVALRVDSDHSAFFRCSVEGYQDTLYAHSLRQFYRECNIYGTIDFIFGNGAAVLQNCNIFTRKPLPLQKVTITAQGRKNPYQSTGFSIQDSFVYATYPTYLGRPWKQYSRTVFMNTYMTNQVQPRGWLEWAGDFALSSLFYGEYKNYGPGSSLAGRVRWPGYHVMSDATAASFFTVERFIDGGSWLPATGVKFSIGLTK
ncbi:hypothetical protein HHK36_020815 [Tetracentron sinense]|uniref:Pectinesterase n=1 Tax=Tetracentron sinense TaxID=13715 RepID=A0A834YXR1_TETSI|nr:hypothetical protein HHK36_020815 [Tetracentron sinense]